MDRFIYVGFQLSLMNKKRSMQTLLVLGTILTLGLLGLTSSNVPLYAGDDDYDADDDHINWKKFKNSGTYEDADKDTKNCFKAAHDRGDNLAGYEVEGCEEDGDYGGDGNNGKDHDDDNNDYGKDSDDDDGDDGDDGKDSDDDDGDDGDDGKDSDDDDGKDGGDGDDGKDSDGGDGDDGKDSDGGGDGDGEDTT
jgi:hypothetical protein